jgi:ribosomal protein S18 acetylase RimI-like enzyme
VDLADRRYAQKCEIFCLRHALVCELGGEIAGMVFGYRLAVRGESSKLAGLCQSLKPLCSLEARLPASFYVNTLAVYPRHRNHGLGAVLLDAAERKARKAHCSCLLLEVAEENRAALRFYDRHGFSPWPPAFGCIASGTRIAVLEKPLVRTAGSG